MLLNKVAAKPWKVKNHGTTGLPQVHHGPNNGTGDSVPHPSSTDAFRTGSKGHTFEAAADSVLSPGFSTKPVMLNNQVWIY